MLINYLSPSKQLITINLTDNQDPLFMFTVDIGEQEFHTLKQEQCLLFEFQQFPQKFFEMLEPCSSFTGNLRDEGNVNNLNINLNKSSSSSYTIILHHTNINEALLIIQEATQFRQLSHLILRVKLASDSLLKKYLSNQVKEFKAKAENLTGENSKLCSNLDNANINLKIFKDELNSFKEKQ